MNFKYLVLFLGIIALVLLGACSNDNSSAVCPPLGSVTGIDEPGSPLQVNNLIDSNMPNFSWDCVDSNSLKVNDTAQLSDLIGKPLIIVFHKSMNCPGCKAQLPYIKGAYENLKDSGLTILTVYRSDMPQDVKSYVTSNGINFTSIADPEDMVASKLGFAIGAPISVFVDKKGVIKKYQIGPLGSQEEIEEAIKSL